MTFGSPEALRALARQHLPSDAAERWLGLLRPAVRLEAAADGDLVVGQLGGAPRLPAGVEWPYWPGHGALSFIASLDCASLDRASLPESEEEVRLPREGTLSFFYFDGQLDDGEAQVLPEERESWAGARVVHTPPDGTGTGTGIGSGSGTGTDPGPGPGPTAGRTAPAGLTPYPRVPLTARRGMSAAEPWHPRLRDAFAPDAPLGHRYEHPVCAQEFLEAVWEFDEAPGHQIGGHAHAVQNPVEIEVAAAVLGGDGGDEGPAWDHPALAEEAHGWVPLAQFDSDDAAGMEWGDAGTLYWLIRPRDLAACRFDRAMFTWQCG
ncbi:YwqG family protein [Streptomyces sp. NPDC048172]|uniref:YwqG family protein n=1 Tax=Streptomyces sp. NPDC048172 TaxID=3365505 RepID=UPI0037210621